MRSRRSKPRAIAKMLAFCLRLRKEPLNFNRTLLGLFAPLADIAGFHFVVGNALRSAVSSTWEKFSARTCLRVMQTDWSNRWACNPEEELE